MKTRLPSLKECSEMWARNIIGLSGIFHEVKTNAFSSFISFPWYLEMENIRKKKKKKEESVHKIQESITSVQVLDRFIQRLLSWLMNRVLMYRSCFLLGLQGGQRELRKDWTEVWLNTLHEICCAFLRVLVQPWPVGKTFTWLYEFR